MLRKKFDSVYQKVLYFWTHLPGAQEDAHEAYARWVNLVATDLEKPENHNRFALDPLGTLKTMTVLP